MRPALHRFDRFVRRITPWISLGLVVALFATWLRPFVGAPSADTTASAPAPASTGAATSSVPVPLPVASPAASVPVALPSTDASTVPVQSRAVQGPYSYATAVRAAGPAVVGISTESIVRGRDVPAGLPDEFIRLVPETAQRVQAAGSGVILDSRGYIVTNHHVIAGANEVSVQLADGRRAKARVVGSDPDTDLAVLQVSLRPLPLITIGRSDQLAVGDVVLAIGNPLALGQTVTQGIVSATGRGQLGLAQFESFIQTDAAINLGNSGGALVDAAGRLVGINTAVLARQNGTEGIGFAIPMNLVRGVVAELIDNGRVARGWLGAGMHDVETVVPAGATPAAADVAQDGGGRARLRGVAVAGLVDNSPAERAGLGTRDLILRLDGQRVVDTRDLVSRLAQRHPGTKVRLEGYRLGASGLSPFKVTVTLGERPQQASEIAQRYPGLIPG